MGHETQILRPTTQPILPLPARPAPLRRALYASQETTGETLGIAAQMERAERFGHRFVPDDPGAPEAEPVPAGGAEVSAPIQRVKGKEVMTLRSGKKVAAIRAAKKIQKPLKKKKSAADRLARWLKRGTKRRDRGRFPTGRYKTSTGPITMGGMHDQRMTQARMADYAGETYGGLPPYGSLTKDLPRWATSAIYQKLTSAQVKKLTAKQKLAASLSTALPNVSEEDRAPGIGKLTRALARQHVADASEPHPFDTSVNPAVSTAKEARELMSGKTKLNKSQISAIDNYASDSSDGEEDETTGTRLLKKMKKV